MYGEIITLETAEKLANLNKALKYIDKQLRGAYTINKLSWESVVQLQSIENILKGKEVFK